MVERTFHVENVNLVVVGMKVCMLVKKHFYSIAHYRIYSELNSISGGIKMVQVINSNQTMRDDMILVNDVFFAHPSNNLYAAVNPTEQGNPVKPLLDIPLGACHVLLHKDGFYYMTGTYGGYDVKENDGIYMWKSSDLIQWEALGKIFDIEQDGSWCKSHAIRFQIQTRLGQQKLFLKDEPGCDFRAILSPKLFAIHQEIYLTFAMNYGGTGILKSTTGLPQGPYVDYAKITEDGYSSSLFVDEDQSIYYLYDSGKIARMSSDLRNVVEPFTEIHISHDYQQFTTVQRAVDTKTVGVNGAYMIKHEGYYYLFCADYFYRMGHANYDQFVAVSPSLTGPFSKRYLAIPHGAEATYFQDKNQVWHAAISGHDQYSFHNNRFSVIPMTFQDHRYLRPADRIILENSPVGKSRKLHWQEGAGDFIRDTQIEAGPDGYYYLTGTTKASSDHQGIELWRSHSLDDFEYIGLVWQPDLDQNLWYNQQKNGQTRAFWAPEIHFVRNNYYITFSLQFGGTVLLKSTSGRGEGPYEMVGQMTSDLIDSSLFEDDDGTVYFVWQDGRIARMKEDMTGFAEEAQLLTDANREVVGYEGVFIVKIDGKYVLGAASWNGDIRVDGTYDLMCAVSDQLYGPYSPRKVAVPHGGHGTIFKAFDGQWYSTLFGNDRTAPYRKRPGIIKVSRQGDLISTIE